MNILPKSDASAWCDSPSCEGPPEVDVDVVEDYVEGEMARS